MTYESLLLYGVAAAAADAEADEERCGTGDEKDWNNDRRSNDLSLVHWS